MNSTSVAKVSTASKKAQTSSTLANNGRLKTSDNKSKKVSHNNKADDTGQSQNNSNNTNNKLSVASKNKNNSMTDNKNKSSLPADQQAKKKANDNKNISIFYRPVKRKPPYKPSEVDFHIGVDFESFGKEAPKHALIGGRDPNSQLQLQPTTLVTPSPCDYNPVLIPSMVSPTPLHHCMSRASSSLHGPIIVEGEMSKESNLKLDYLDPDIYKTLETKGNIKSIIGNVEHAPKFYSDLMQTAISVPGCTFIPSRELSLSNQGVKIGNRKPTNYETANPGPGEYRPELKMNSLLSRAPSHQLSGPQFRFDWLEDKRNIPSPSQYNPQRLETSSPQFSIGVKSRINRNNLQKKVNISEESTRIALHNAESREVVTAPSKSRNRYRNASKSGTDSNYYIPSEVNRKNRQGTRNVSSAIARSAYYNERFNNTSSASRREREKVDSMDDRSRFYAHSNFDTFNIKKEEETVYSSFYSKCVNVNSNKKNVVPLPVGPFIMKLDVSEIPLQEARKYIAKRPELVAWVEFIIDQVMYEKPENPLFFIREIFLAIKENDAQKESPYDDEFNLNQIIVHMKEKTTDFVY